MFRVSGIKWCIGEDEKDKKHWKIMSLPIKPVLADVDDEDEVVEYLSNRYGFLIESIEKIEKVEPFALPVEWTMSGIITCYGTDLVDAIRYEREITDAIPFPDGDYVDGTWTLVGDNGFSSDEQLAEDYEIYQ